MTAASDAGVNLGEVERAVRTLIEPGAVVEVRALLGRKRVVAGYFRNDAEGLAALCKGVKIWSTQQRERDRPDGTYITLNPIDPQLLPRSCNHLTDGLALTTSDANVTRRRWLLVDVDPDRPAGVSSTEEQHAEALRVAAAIAAFLLERGIQSVEADSGNGGHVLIPISLENSDEARTLLERILKALSWLFDNERVHVDRATFNASRLSKLYGTIAGKGDSTPEQPHRLARILRCPEEIRPCPEEDLQWLAGLAPEEPTSTPKAAGRGDRFDIDAFMARHCPDADAVPYKGGRKWQLAECPFNPDHKKPDAIVTEAASGALGFKCSHNSCSGRNWSDFRDHLEPGGRDRRNGHDKPPRPTDCERAAPARAKRGIVPEPMCAVKPPEIITEADLDALDLEDPEFVVDRILPIGYAVMCSKPKIGKTRGTSEIAVAVSQGGRALGKIEVGQGDVLFLALEDNRIRLQTRLRTIRKGAEPSGRLHLVTEWPRADAGGLDLLRQWLKEHPDCRLVIVDTLAKIRPPRQRNTDIYADDYAFGASLKKIADEAGICLLALHHQRKGASEDVFDTASGTLGLTAPADTIWVLQRARGAARAQLHITGRDVEEQELELEVDAHTGAWTLLGDTSEVRRSVSRKDIQDFLRAARQPVSPKAIADGLDKNRSTVRNLLRKMAFAGEVIVGDDGAYTVDSVDSVDSVDAIGTE
jgi:hypothetical protein